MIHEFSSLRTPQQNVVVERKNRTLQEMARTMIHENNLAKHLWGRSSEYTTCYVQNRIYIRHILEKTTYSLREEDLISLTFINLDVPVTF